MVSTLFLKCRECGIEFEIVKKEYNRQLKRGRQPEHFFCSGSCSSRYHNLNMSTEERHQRNEQLKKVTPNHIGNTYSKKGNFTYYLNKCRNRNKKLEFDLDESLLEFLWRKQEGRCAITGAPLTIQNSKTKKTPSSASLDRIDSSEGYVPGNVQFLAYAVNMAKNDFEQDVICEFFSSLFEKKNPTSNRHQRRTDGQ